MDKMYISVRELCHVAGIGHTLAHKLIRDGVLTSTRVGGRRLVLLSSVQALTQEANGKGQR